MWTKIARCLWLIIGSLDHTAVWSATHRQDGWAAGGPTDREALAPSSLPSPGRRNPDRQCAAVERSEKDGFAMEPGDPRPKAAAERNSRDRSEAKGRTNVSAAGHRAESGQVRQSGEDARAPVALLVLGMHRSLTSAITGSLAHAGAAIPVNLLPADGNNPKGYFESSQINAALERLLTAAGSRWHDWRALSLERIPPDELDKIRRQLQFALQAEFGSAALFALKDPRICRCVPFWREVLAEFGARPLAIIPIRHPLAVALSLQKRDGMPREKALLLWFRHVMDAERTTRDIPRVFLLSEAFAADPAASLGSIAQRLGIEWPRSGGPLQDRLDAFIVADLVHHTDEARQAPRSPIARWYEPLLALAERLAGGETDLAPQLDALYADFLTGTAPFEAYCDAMEVALLKQQESAVRLKKALDRARWLLGSVLTEQQVLHFESTLDDVIREQRERLVRLENRVDELSKASSSSNGHNR
ncbi:sulfotransferase family protein [Faunimonas sp. B44]